MTTTRNPIARAATAQAILVPLAVGVVAALAGYLVGSHTPAPPAAPAAAATSASDGGVAVDSRLAQSLGVRTVEAKSGTLETGFRATGAVAVDERSLTGVQSRV